MYYQAISEDQRRALSALKPAADRGFYLAGGTGLCLRLAHRRSIDLDLFRTEPFDPESLLRDFEAEGLTASNVRSERNTLWFDLAGVRTSLMRFPYPNIGRSDPGIVVPVASLIDIAAMKVEAIASRGALKDFYDLYFICKEGPGVAGALAAFREKFRDARPDVMHRLKALTYFEDAERDPEPLLLKPATWAQVRQYFEEEARALWERPT